MVTPSRNYQPVDEDCRQNPRIAFYLPVSIMGMDVQASITDFSLSGFYIQLDATDYFSENQSLRLVLRLPGEKASTLIKVRVARIDRHGIGCEFMDLDAATTELLGRHFEIFRWTLPIR